MAISNILGITSGVLGPYRGGRVGGCFRARPCRVGRPCIRRAFPISVPLFGLNFGRGTSGPLGRGRLTYASVLLSTLTSGADVLCEGLVSSGLVGSDFSCRLFRNPNCYSMVFNNRSETPGRTTRVVGRCVSSVGGGNVSGRSFRVTEGSICNSSISSLGSMDTVSGSVVSCTVRNGRVFTCVSTITGTGLRSVGTELTRVLSIGGYALSIMGRPSRIWLYHVVYDFPSLTKGLVLAQLRFRSIVAESVNARWSSPTSFYLPCFVHKGTLPIAELAIRDLSAIFLRR